MKTSTIAKALLSVAAVAAPALISGQSATPGLVQNQCVVPDSFTYSASGPNELSSSTGTSTTTTTSCACPAGVSSDFVCSSKVTTSTTVTTTVMISAIPTPSCSSCSTPTALPTRSESDSTPSDAATSAPSDMPTDAATTSAPTDAGTTTAGVASELTPTGTPTTQLPYTIGVTNNWQSMGCYDKSLFVQRLNVLYNTQTIEFCQTAASSHGYSFVGLYGGISCYGAMDIDFTNATLATDCGIPCSGNVAELCGGIQGVSVYSFSGVLPTGTGTVITVRPVLNNTLEEGPQ